MALQQEAVEVMMTSKMGLIQNATRSWWTRNLLRALNKTTCHVPRFEPTEEEQGWIDAVVALDDGRGVAWTFVATEDVDDRSVWLRNLALL